MYMTAMAPVEVLIGAPAMLLGGAVAFFVLWRIMGKTAGETMEGAAERVAILARLVDGTSDRTIGRKGTYWDVKGAYEGRPVEVRCTTASITYKVSAREGHDSEAHFTMEHRHDDSSAPLDSEEKIDLSRHVNLTWRDTGGIDAREVLNHIGREKLESLVTLGNDTLFHMMYIGDKLELRVPASSVADDDAEGGLRAHLDLVGEIVGAVEKEVTAAS
jgi:hypothetical protein